MSDGFYMEVDLRKLEQIIRDLGDNVDDLLLAMGNEMSVDMQLSMYDSPADGASYQRGSVVHVSSSPGNPPRPDTGELAASVTYGLTGEHEVTIHDQVEYGAYQEFGTETLAARPWMRPVFETWRNGQMAQFIGDWPLVR